jgi:hypothetical protein
MTDIFAWPLNEGPNVERRKSVRISGHDLYLSHMAEVRALNRDLAAKDVTIKALSDEITELRAKVAAYAAKENS